MTDTNTTGVEGPLPEWAVVATDLFEMFGSYQRRAVDDSFSRGEINQSKLREQVSERNEDAQEWLSAAKRVYERHGTAYRDVETGDTFDVEVDNPGDSGAQFFLTKAVELLILHHNEDIKTRAAYYDSRFAVRVLEQSA